LHNLRLAGFLRKPWGIAVRHGRVCSGLAKNTAALSR